MKKPKLPQDLPMKMVIGGLIVFSFVQWMAKAAIIGVVQEIKERKKSL